jgi:3-methyladenine DNA glycosylase/8-oxoguanine DNA glycosylase
VSAQRRRSGPPTLKPRVAQRALALDPAFGPWVARIGPVRMRRVAEPGFPYLVRSIVYQQLAGKAAATIHGRCVEACGGKITPHSVKKAPEEALRSAGLSRGKLTAVRDLADKARSLRFDALASLDDEEVVERLTTVRGVGRWTAQMFLIFALRRPDVWPAGDLGVRAGYARILGLADTPREREMEPLGEPYRPWRSAAAWYCWRALETEIP